MTYKIKYSPMALKDLARIWEEVYKASSSENITHNYVNELMDVIEDKKIFPESGAPLYYKDLFTGYRFVIYKSYVAFYRVEDESVFVDRILYGASDYMRTLGFTV